MTSASTPNPAALIGLVSNKITELELHTRQLLEEAKGLKEELRKVPKSQTNGI